MNYLAKIYTSIASGVLFSSAIMGVFLAGEKWGNQTLFFGFLSMIIIVSYAFLYRKRSDRLEAVIHLAATISHITIWVMYLDFTFSRISGSPGDFLYSINYSLIYSISLYFYSGIALSLPLVFFTNGKVEAFLSSQMATAWKSWFIGALAVILVLASAYILYIFLSIDPVDFG